MSVFVRLMLLVAVTMFVSACQSDNQDEPRMTERELMNRSKLNPYPEEVKGAFLRDYPHVTITEVRHFTDETGRVLYEVSFVRDGQMDRAVYTSEGVRIREMEEAPRPPADPAAPPAPPAPPAGPRQ